MDLKLFQFCLILNKEILHCKNDTIWLVYTDLQFVIQYLPLFNYCYVLQTKIALFSSKSYEPDIFLHYRHMA